MSKSLVCWSCGFSAAQHPMPLSTYAECSSCNLQLHVCKMCKHRNPTLRVGCDETRAEEVSELEKANFCEWFLPKLDVFQSDNKNREAHSTHTELNALFKKGNMVADTFSKDQRARQELEDLFSTRLGGINEENPPESGRGDA